MKKENRIKKNHEIASIVNQRKKVASKNFVFYYQTNQENKLRVAFSVSKKYGLAVDRNKAKRISRNLLRKYINIYNNLKNNGSFHFQSNDDSLFLCLYRKIMKRGPLYYSQNTYLTNSRCLFSAIS